MPNQQLLRLLWCCAVVAIVCLYDLLCYTGAIYSPNTTASFYVYKAFVDFTAIILLSPIAAASKTARLVIASYAAYALTHFAGFAANTFGITFLYNMYHPALIVILMAQLIILAMDNGNIRGIRRRDKGSGHIPAIIVADSFHTDFHKERD